ncbi:hypothetical protein LINPERPRIM_LOCUS32743 [Linum perenne]
MDSDEEFLQFADAEEAPPSPVPRRRLKRLRRVTSSKDSENASPRRPAEDLPLIPPVTSPSPFKALDPAVTSSSPLEALDSAEKHDESELEGLKSRSVSLSMRFEQEINMDYRVDSLGTDGRVTGVKRLLEFGSDGEELDGENRDKMASVGMGQGNSDSKSVEAEKEQSALDGNEGNKNKAKKKKKKSSDGYDEKASSGVPSKRGGQKQDRKNRLKELRAESQRLLRETRDASFKPQPLVQKPLSTVLEKIRQRRLELSKRSAKVADISPADNTCSSPGGFSVNLDFVDDQVEDIEYPYFSTSDGAKTVDKPADMEENTDVHDGKGSKDTASPNSRTFAPDIALGEEPKQTFRAPVDDTQDLLFDSQTSDSKDDLLDETPSSPLEEVLAPSLLTMKLKFDSVRPHDSSSDEEEDNDKENVDPHHSGSIGLSRDPMKAFIDEEAEEEDDSDNDLHRFQDNEEDEDDIDSEELNDIIATGFEEKPVDGEMRNELHQKWLEQQDAVGTEHLMKRLNCGGSKLKETTSIEEKEEESNWDGEFLDNGGEDRITRNVMQMHLKKAKEMIHQMFTDKDDPYISSDDEETERNIVKQRMFVNREDEAVLVSPVEDESSNETFRIKKMNNVPDSKKKSKISSHFNQLSIGGNKATKSKSSFLNRGSKNKNQSLQKHGSSILRSFIFERDDSNSSKDTVLMTDDSSDSIHKEEKARKVKATKLMNSQIRSSLNSSSKNTQAKSQTNPGPSLHDILRGSRRSSLVDDAAFHVEPNNIYTAFKLDQSLVKRSAASVSVTMI